MMSEFEIWTEGFQISGNQAQASKLGTVEAETFAEACDKLCSPLEWQQKHGRYDSRSGGVWGCRLFDNEADARRSFG